MISDEMRELLSSYLDDELRDSDAVRVEQMSKRDPELRREIDAYRTLRRQLRDWDRAEHGLEPPPTMKQRALARAHALNDIRAAGPVRRGGRVLRLPARPAAVAAALLLATALGVVLAGLAGEGEPVPVSSAGDVLDHSGYESRPVFIAKAKRVELKRLAPLPHYEPLAPALREGLRGWLVEGQVWTRRSLQFLVDWAEQRDQLASVKARTKVRPETRTVAAPKEMLEIVRGYRPASAPAQGMVLLRHQVPVEPVLNPTGIPGATPIARDSIGSADRVIIDTSRLKRERGETRLLLAGEILRGERDKTDRLRFVAGSSWIRDSEVVPVVWGDSIGLPASARDLTLQPEMLGPEARRRLARTSGDDPAFRTWLRAHYRRADLLGGGRKDRDRKARRLVELLKRDPSATGFAVIGADGEVAGVELFATHDLLLAFAPRLLSGYLMESKGEIGVRAPTRGVPDLQRRAGAVVDRVTLAGLRLVAVSGGSLDWPAKLRRVNILGARDRLLGHGLLIDGRPLQITLFR